VKWLEDLGPSKLTDPEQELIRNAADSLFFCEDVASDEAAREALAEVEALTGRLVESDRWLPETAERLLDDVEGCGPLGAPVS
jgi:predicted metal-dependent enzyme (double-stranded beta helix superfamily)